MARTLPWLKNASTTTSHPSNPRPSKRQRTHSPSSDTETRPRLTTVKHKQVPLRSARTPSTSPPPQPPPPSPLRPGLHADDIYIMVEDEFLATARAFTAHLHHAEYVRLKNAAKARSEKAVSGLGIGIERPVDGVTAMRAETRKRKEAETRDKKVREAVDSIVAAPGEGRRLSDGEEGSDFEEGERYDDPWQGTQLQHFMTKSPKKAGMGVGLTGLQGVVSHTRAAAGFQKWEKKKDGRAGSPTATRDGDREEEDDEEDEDTDDLDLPSYPHHPPLSTTRPTPSLTKPKSKPTQPVKHPPPPPPKPNLKAKLPRAFLDITPLHKTPAKLPPAPQIQPVIKQEQGLVKVESVDRGKGEGVSRGIRERAEARRRRREGGREGGRVGDEIPVFLV